MTSSATGATVAMSLGSDKVRYDICVGALTSGCISSFVELFTLLHRQPIIVDELSQATFSIPEEHYDWLQKACIEVELERRNGSFSRVFDRLLELVHYFESNRSAADALRLFKEAEEVCQASLDLRLQAHCQEKFADFCARTKMPSEAVVHAEARLKLWRALGDGVEARKACRELVGLYIAHGTALQQAGSASAALAQFQSAVHVSRVHQDTLSEAEAYAALGHVTSLQGDMDRSLKFQQRFLLLATEENNAEQKSRAALAVGRLQQQLGGRNSAIESLEAALETAEAVGDLRAACEACGNLGDCYKSNGDRINAVHFFRKQFQLACKLEDEELMDSARAILGFSLGEYLFLAAGNGKGFLHIVCNDMASQLEWISKGIL